MREQVDFDLDQIPFSMSGSWLSVSRVVGLHQRAQTVHLVSHQTGMHPILALQPLDNGAEVTALPTANPSSLRWQTPRGFIELAYSDPQTVRVRGQGLALRLSDAATELTSFTGNYLFVSPIDGAAVMTSYETGRRYRMKAQSGSFTAHGSQAVGRSPRFLVVGADGGDWDLLISESESVGEALRDPRTFDQVVKVRESEFGSFADAVAPWRSADPTATLATYVLWCATVHASGFVTRDAVLMSKHWMDKIWSWDHCFNALALAASHPQFALDQFLLVFDHQTEDGAIPDSVAHSEVLYNFVKPPIHGWAFQELRRRLPTPVPSDTLRLVYQRLAAWSRFWLDHRRAGGSALPFYEHGNDSGWDNSTVFDLDRVVESPDLASFLLMQLEALAEIADEVAPQESDGWRAEAELLARAVEDSLWDGDELFARSVGSHRRARSTSLLPALSILAWKRLPPAATERLVDKIRHHLTDHGLATELIDSDLYEADGYWRGPIWAPSTFIAHAGLTSLGEYALAERIAQRFADSCRRSGFAENFDALTGAGLRDRAYTWTASVYLLLTAPDGQSSPHGGV